MINPFTATGGGQTPDEPQPVGTGPRLAEAFQWIAQNDPTTVAAAKVLVRAGGAVVLANPTGPDQKAPWDLRTAYEKAADGAAHGPDRSKGGVWSATTDPDRLDAILERATQNGRLPNIGLNVGLSGLVLVDCDQAGQVEAVQKMAQPDDPEGYVPTTRSPGVKRDGEWHHSGGGHFLFYDDIGLGPVSKFTMESKADVFADGGRYVMTPPSEREEGKYAVTGPVRPLSEAPWLSDILHKVAEERAVQDEARRERPEASTDDLGPFDVWNDAHEWSELLERADWEPTGRGTECGCLRWVINGRKGNSGTVHEPGCTSASVNIVGGSGPLHVWTSDLPDELAVWARKYPGRSDEYVRFTKAQFAAAMWHDSDLAAFAEAEGLEVTLGDLATFRLDDVVAKAFWESHPNLGKIRDLSARQGVNPWAVLLTVLTVVLDAIPPYVVLPAIVGSASPLNMYVGLVGHSGDGKGAATNLGRQMVTGTPDLHLFHPGSGEGFLREFANRPGTAGPASRDRRTLKRSATAHLDSPEVSNLYAHASRNGNTAVPHLLSMWSGEAVGNTAADPTKALTIPPLSYRITAVLGVQPKAADTLLGTDDVGLVQRFLFTRASVTVEDLDRAEELSDGTDTTGIPEELKVDLSHIGRTFPDKDPHGYRCLDNYIPPVVEDAVDEDGNPTFRQGDQYPPYEAIPEDHFQYVEVGPAARADIRAERRRRAARDPYAPVSKVEEIQAHAGLLRLRVAVALSVLFGGNGDITDEVWDLAGVIMARHNDALEFMLEVQAKAVMSTAEARGKAMGHQNLAASEVVQSAEAAKRERAENILTAALENAGTWVSRTKVRESVSKPLRTVAYTVLDEWVEDGRVETMEGEKARNGKRPILYRLA